MTTPKHNPRWRHSLLRSVGTVGLVMVVACGALAASDEPRASTSAETPAPGKKNEVIVLGMIHGEHRTSEHYGIDVVKNLIRSIGPDVVLVEIPPDRLPTALAEFESTGVIAEPRVVRFPEYVDALFPLTREMDFEIVATAGWTKPMADARRDALAAIRNDPDRAEDWAAYERANQQADAAIAAGGDDGDPRFIHTDAYDNAVEIGLAVYNRLFNDELGDGGWDNINDAHYGHIADALDRHTGEGKRFLITYGAGHKGWFLRQLRQRDDIELLDVGPFLDRIAPNADTAGDLDMCRDGGRTQAEMAACAARAVTAADEALRTLIDALGRMLDSQQMADLHTNQALWDRFRVADCGWQRDLSAGGSISPVIYANCLEQRTNERIARLKIFLCEGAGMAGPCEASERFQY